MKKLYFASLFSLAFVLVGCFSGCARMHQMFGKACKDGSCSPAGHSTETIPQREDAGFLQSGGGSGVFGGNISSPARGASFGGGFGG